MNEARARRSRAIDEVTGYASSNTAPARHRPSRCPRNRRSTSTSGRLVTGPDWTIPGFPFEQQRIPALARAGARSFSPRGRARGRAQHVFMYSQICNRAVADPRAGTRARAAASAPLDMSRDAAIARAAAARPRHDSARRSSAAPRSAEAPRAAGERHVASTTWRAPRGEHHVASTTWRAPHSRDPARGGASNADQRAPERHAISASARARERDATEPVVDARRARASPARGPGGRPHLARAARRRSCSPRAPQ